MPKKNDAKTHVELSEINKRDISEMIARLKGKKPREPRPKKDYFVVDPTKNSTRGP